MSASRNPVEHLIVCPCKRQEPWFAVIKTVRRSWERNLCEGIVGLLFCDPLGHFLALPGCHGDAVSGVAKGKVESFQLPGMRHDVEAEIERAAPDVLDSRIT